MTSVSDFMPVVSSCFLREEKITILPSAQECQRAGIFSTSSIQIKINYGAACSRDGEGKRERSRV